MSRQQSIRGPAVVIDRTDVRSALACLLDDAVAYYSRRYPDLRVEGPFDAHDPRPLLPVLSAFADRYTSRFLPHLDDAFHRDLETRLAAVSQSRRFGTMSDATPVGQLQIRTGAHEFPLVAPGLVSHDVSEYAEYSRLMVMPTERSTGIGRLLVASATRWLLRHSEATGIIALCRSETAKVFYQYGLQRIAKSAPVPLRQNQLYHLMGAPWSVINAHLTSHHPRELKRAAAR